ncbi:MAG: glutamine--fructose-6-phosphate transaminase (isomerizing) [Thermoflexales bacterium]|nr:glutamine--fructose-6-phosphate transaminase (isomerizing) [Thermoflexales bacterium]
MCGIVGYVGHRDATALILEGLRRLEYRGYDSAGIAVVETGGTLGVRRNVGKLSNLAVALQAQPLQGNIGIGHTRWATHGQPSETNAHPHTDCTGNLVVIHNGIVENFHQLREQLKAAGHTFVSETDTEVIVHLVEEYVKEGATLEDAARRALVQLKGAHGIVLMSRLEPDRLVCARIGNAGGVTIGLGSNGCQEMFVASDMPAILEHTRRMIFLESRQMAVVMRDGVKISSLDTGERLELPVHTIPYDPIAAAKGEYRHFMQKEIFEQARSTIDTIRGRVDFEHGRVVLDDMRLTAEQARRIDKLFIVACGTSYYAALVGRFIIEQLARLPVEVEYGSEFRYRDSIIDSHTAVLSITQSGETVDTLVSMEKAREKGAMLWSIVNVIGSQAHRLADGAILMQAGPEIGVASTKAFTASIADQYLLGCYLGQLRGTLSAQEARSLVSELSRLPDLMGQVLEQGQQRFQVAGGAYIKVPPTIYEDLANRFHDREHFLYLGRGINYPIALEGALKLKEISYIHAEGYPAGEMKHGPIALIDERMPVVTVAVRDKVYDKMISQIEQVKARGGIVIAVATEGDELVQQKADFVLYIPPISELLTPALAVLPLQMLAYHLAVRRGCDVDQPRNLAKSVTVE